MNTRVGDRTLASHDALIEAGGRTDPWMFPYADPLGTGSGTRTHTSLRSADFESAASSIPPSRRGNRDDRTTASSKVPGFADGILGRIVGPDR